MIIQSQLYPLFSLFKNIISAIRVNFLIACKRFKMRKKNDGDQENMSSILVQIQKKIEDIYKIFLGLKALKILNFACFYILILAP